MKKQVGRSLIPLILVICLPLSLPAKEVCEFFFNDCPESFNNDTIIVPEHVVALSSSVLACSTSIASNSSPPPSIMFVIDHSPSMGGQSGANDQNGSRFSVTKDFIDSIYAKQPKAEVGLVVFSGHLFFNTASTNYYTKYFKGLPQITDAVSPNQAYVVMLTLDSTYGDKKGIDILKDILATKATTVSGQTFTDLVYKPNVARSSTDINLAFYAAKDAMVSAKNPPERQFVIFLSDGEANSNVVPGVTQNDFVSGKNMPTTFTVYFTSSSTAPQNMRNMTNNIKINGYSTSNKNSGLWAIQADHKTLLDLLMKSTMNQILIPGSPSHMIINGITSVTATSTSFQFPNDFALTGVNTNFTAQIKYQYTNPGKSTKDTTINLNFVVKRSKNAPLPAGIGTNCWAQPSLQFYYDNSPISEVTEAMKQLQIRLSPNGETVSSATVELKSSLESMPVTLSLNGSYCEKTFTRVTQSTAVNDNILQHIPADSIIAIYRNPALPLDSVRIAIPVRVAPSTIPVTAILRDTSGNGHIDRIDLTWAVDTIDILKTLPPLSVFVLNTQITTLDGTVIKLTPGAVIERHGDTLSIIINETTGNVLETGWNSAIVSLSNVTVTEQGNAFYVDKIIDGTGPVVQRVLYYPGTGLNPRDTLKVTLSEPLNCDLLSNGSPSSAFKYFKGGKLDQEILPGASFIINCESGFVTEFRIVLNSNGLVTPEDSMSIFGNSNSVVDKNGNRSNPNNRMVAIEWGIENNISIAVSNNPFIPGKTEINDPILKYYVGTNEKITGTIIGITSIKLFQKRSDDSYGSAVIYDAVGNLIKKNLPVKKTTNAGSNFYVLWDGRNDNNRFVGAGTYLLVLSGSVEGNKYIKKIKIGVTQ